MLPQLLILSLLVSCQGNPFANPLQEAIVNPVYYDSIRAIPPPEGYKRIKAEPGSFGEWLRKLPLKKDNTVYLYNGVMKEDQSVQFAVLDIPVGKKDLQQCADAVMRLRAEYLFAHKRYDEIEFRDNNNKAYRWTKGNDRAAFERYLEQVFGWCGSASLSKQMKAVHDVNTMQPGDVFIEGGFPGHAMIVIDVAVNKQGKKAFMMAQSFMPAQDIHIVRSTVTGARSCWYEMDDSKELVTPEWIFRKSDLKTW
jgi:hypothetical protein